MIIHDVEQRTEEWFAIRAGMPTASEFSKIITLKGDASRSLQGYAAELAAQTWAGRPLDQWEGNRHTERGNELEPQALDFYSFASDVDVTPVGFVSTDDATAGCSPDGLVGDDGLVEIKCLSAKRHVEALDYMQRYSHTKPPPEYVAQTQGQIYICERKWCDLVFYHPDLPSIMLRQTPIETVQANLPWRIGDVTAERDRLVAVLKQSA